MSAAIEIVATVINLILPSSKAVIIWHPNNKLFFSTHLQQTRLLTILLCMPMLKNENGIRLLFYFAHILLLMRLNISHFYFYVLNFPSHVILLVLYFIFLIFRFFSWSIFDLQCCVSFWCTEKWYSYAYICIYTYVYIVFQILFHCRLL